VLPVADRFSISDTSDPAEHLRQMKSNSYGGESARNVPSDQQRKIKLLTVAFSKTPNI
jgi:hypothetical protein